MRLNEQEMKNFNFLLKSVFNPVLSECKDDITKIISSDDDLKRRIEEEVELILKKRMLKKAESAKLVIKIDTTQELINNQICPNKPSHTVKQARTFQSIFQLNNDEVKLDNNEKFRDIRNNMDERKTRKYTQTIVTSYIANKADLLPTG